MKSTATILIVLCGVTIGGSCRIQAAQETANPATEQTQENQNPKPDPRFEKIPVKYHAYLKTVANEEPRLIDSWQSVMALYDDAYRCATIFGLRERKQARKQLKSIRAKIKIEHAKFTKDWQHFKKPIEEEEAKLKSSALKLSERKDAFTNQKINQRLNKLYDQSYVFGEQLNALKALQSAIPEPAYSIPSDLAQIGFGVHDRDAMKFAQENPRLVEARLTVKDCQADIATLQKMNEKIDADPNRRWGNREESQMKRANQNLDKAVNLLEREIEKAKAPLLRDIEKLQKKIDGATEKIEDAEKRNRKATTYQKRLGEYEDELSDCNRIIDIIDKFATWKQSKKK